MLFGHKRWHVQKIPFRSVQTNFRIWFRQQMTGWQLNSNFKFCLNCWCKNLMTSSYLVCDVINLKLLFFIAFDSKTNQKLILDEIKGRLKAVSELKIFDKKDNRSQFHQLSMHKFFVQKCFSLKWFWLWHFLSPKYALKMMMKLTPGFKRYM
jgi:hypothetical protein